MKKTILISMLSSALFAGVVQNKDGTFLEIFANKNSQSSIISTVSTSKGKIIRKNCSVNRSAEEWCKIIYSYSGMEMRGYSDKKSLDIVAALPGKKLTFEQTYGGDRDEVGNDLIVLEDGILIVGYTDSFGAGQKDTYIIKVDNFGNKIFSSAYGGRSDDIANAIVAIDGGFMLAGTTGSFGNRTQSAYLSKITNKGDLVWQKGYFSDKDDYYTANDIAKISDTNFLIAGWEDHVEFFNSEVNMYVNAINTDGQKNGIKRYGGEDKERANSIISVADGYVIAGTTDTWGHGGEDAYVVKIDKDGNRIWHNAFGFKYDETANEIIATKDGGYVFVGTTDSDHDNQKNVYVVKIDKDGNKIWDGHYGTREDDEGLGIVETDDGYMIAGYTKGTKNYDSDVYLIKLNQTGAVLWTKKYGGKKTEKANAIAKVSNGFAITGYSTSKNGYSKDLYLLRVDNNGNIN